MPGYRIHFCFFFKQTLRKTITTLVYSLSQDKVAIVTDEENCAANFYSALETSIHHHEYSEQVRINLRHVIFHKNQPLYQQRQQNGTLHELKLFDASIVVLLIHHHFVSIFLRGVFNSKLISSAILWVIPRYHDDLSPFKWFPEKILSFRTEEKSIDKLPYKKLYKNLTDLLNLYMELKKVASRYPDKIYFSRTSLFS